MTEINEFLSLLVLSADFRKEFIAAMDTKNEKKVKDLLLKKGFSFNDEQFQNILNLEISPELNKKMTDIDDFLHDKSGLDPQW